MSGKTWRVGAALVTGTLWAVLTGSVAAQDTAAVSGRLSAADTELGVPGAMVYLISSEGGAVGVVMTDSLGRFRFGSPPPGNYRLRVDRIGFESESSERFSVIESEVVDLDMALRIRPVAIAGLDVSAKRVCDLEGEGTPLVRVWTEARKALTATMISATRPESQVVVEVSERELSRDLAVREEIVDTLVVPGIHGFGFVPIEQLDSVGWGLKDDDRITLFFGPSPEALLSPWFGRNHCFSLTPARTTGEVGIGFESREGVLEIGMEGVFWIDVSTWRLREIEFRFTGVRDLRDAKEQGGRIVLEVGGDGSWYVEYWEMRSPILQPRRREWREIAPRRRLGTRGYRVAGYVERSGRVLGVRR